MRCKAKFLVLFASSLFLTLICLTSADAQSTKLTVITNLGVPAVLAEPDPLGSRSHVGIVTMHSDGNYLSGGNCIPLAQRGYRALCMNNQFTNNADNIEGFYQIAPTIARGINHLRGLVGAAGNVGVMGHSMGGPLMSFYQNAAEKRSERVQKSSDNLSLPGRGSHESTEGGFRDPPRLTWRLGICQFKLRGPCGG